VETQKATKHTRSAWVVVALAVVVGVLAGAVAVVVLLPNGSSAEAVTLERADRAGDDPFTESVQTEAVPAIEQPAVDAASAARTDMSRDDTTAVLVTSGTEPGLYGGSGDVRVCDADQLVAYLAEHPDKAAAWGSVLGVTPEGIGDYVASLTPVVLLSDTVVTNHGFENGKATELTSVLQAGTAVMVDDQGVPRVKCNCGNPLTPPQVVPSDDWDMSGDAWDGYDPASVTGVVGGDAVTEFTMCDLITGETYTVPVGSAGAGSTPDIDGEWTIGLRTSGGMSLLAPGELDPRICPTAGLEGAVLVVRGRQATVRGASAFGGELTGTAEPPPVELPQGMGGAEIHLRPVGETAPEVTFRLAFSPSSDALIGEVSMTGAQDPSTRVSQCDAGVVARRGSSSAAPTPAPAPSTTAPPAAAVADLQGVDWANRGYRLGAYCSGLEVTLRDGEWEDRAAGIGAWLVEVTYGDVTGDGSDEALVRIECRPLAGNAYPAPLNVVFTSDASGPVQLGEAFNGAEAVIVGDAVQTTDAVWGPNDPRCCPSSTETLTWRYRNGAWVS
jgi:hypothetical protein